MKTDETTDANDPRPEAEIRHRFHRDQGGQGGAVHPRRLIVERDRRRGGSKKPGGSDPPA